PVTARLTYSRARVKSRLSSLTVFISQALPRERYTKEEGNIKKMAVDLHFSSLHYCIGFIQYGYG
ncbi:MAG: hypothetical protein GTO45_08140, partial [Candidatus Aminicenantes bacterium]|nr:hypothetical protein [Candidatus Aminicenantes bacterium]NIM78801.1 hypothetical protein [Candidatus Aminicenantes bacterium]NIN18056.1 hypothetical protein [Candidatus Aminicenantes bacterium]NIN41956.1 hypothetical protein [Candidatus Aminicenantes bacterium]NIN84711.1 hypothetical protein [Candidatus Aminicenantes bacterium]